MQKNAFLLAIVAVHAAENELSEVGDDEMSRWLPGEGGCLLRRRQDLSAVLSPNRSVVPFGKRRRTRFIQALLLASLETT